MHLHILGGMWCWLGIVVLALGVCLAGLVCGYTLFLETYWLFFLLLLVGICSIFLLKSPRRWIIVFAWILGFLLSNGHLYHIENNMRIIGERIDAEKSEPGYYGPDYGLLAIDMIYRNSESYTCFFEIWGPFRIVGIVGHQRSCEKIEWSFYFD